MVAISGAEAALSIEWLFCHALSPRQQAGDGGAIADEGDRSADVGAVFRFGVDADVLEKAGCEIIGSESLIDGGLCLVIGRAQDLSPLDCAAASSKLSPPLMAQTPSGFWPTRPASFIALWTAAASAFAFVAPLTPARTSYHPRVSPPVPR